MKLSHVLQVRFLACIICLQVGTHSMSQGRVVINEYMPWASNACGGATGEFIELLNFGPGPVNIGCYVLTDGDYSITIPPNTILQPGAFFVISGRDTIDYPCANIDSTIHSHLNWNTCNCTSAPIPATGDGFLTDGGSANEQLVLLDPSLNIIDAVARSLPVESSSLITTSTIGGGCSSVMFDLDLMTINYETIGESAGRGNSFARKLDGDCGWVKDPQQSGNATNNTPGDVSDVQYSFAILKAQACPKDGAVQVTVNASNYNDIFPMSYTLAYDTDGDGIFETTDSYTYGTVNNPNKIIVDELVPGRYRLTVASVKGCYLHTFPFTILDCFPVLQLQILSFTAQPTASGTELKWLISNCNELQQLIIEKSKDGINFYAVASLNSALCRTGYDITDNDLTTAYYRLRVTSLNGTVLLSKIALADRSDAVLKLWPNPVTDRLIVDYYSITPGIVSLGIYSVNSQSIIKHEIPVYTGLNHLTVPLKNLPTGSYALVFFDKNQPGKITRLSFAKL